jgi:hypothetical protein
MPSYEDTFYVGNMKGVGRIYQQTFIDTYSKVTFAKLYDRKTPITAADLLNDRVGRGRRANSKPSDRSARIGRATTVRSGAPGRFDSSVTMAKAGSSSDSTAAIIR